ncbi:hypothetical protein ACHAWU_007826 [Discostella pseudostelligera]|uniref:Uncharacterized protein n=1 Tax=Discostella pseudostelligera TaxID=259834 RepID=A0ABD3N334_9STRA
MAISKGDVGRCNAVNANSNDTVEKSSLRGSGSFTEIIAMTNFIAARAQGWNGLKCENNNSIRDNECIKHHVPVVSRRRRGRTINTARRAILVTTCIFTIMIAVVFAAMKKTDNDIGKKQSRGDRLLQSPITSGEVTRHRFRMHTYSGSKSGKGSKISSSKSGKSSMLIYQPIYVSPPPTTEYYRTKTPTATPEDTDLPTCSPTVEDTDLPTSSPIIASSIDETEELTTVVTHNLQMALFGLSEKLLDDDQQQYFERQTATYMEEFYNKAKERDGLLEAIKNEVEDVMIIVKIDDQEYNNRQLKDKRHRQSSTQVTEPCEGSNQLILTFSLELSYRLSGRYPIKSDAVINFPFSSVPYRENYIDEYLKHRLAGGSEETDTDDDLSFEADEHASAVFGDVYCTSRIEDELNKSETPTYFPTLSPTTDNSPTLSPTLDETMVPSILSNAPSMEIDLPPTISPTSESTAIGAPTTVTPAEASSSPTYISTAAPTLRNETTSTVPTFMNTASLAPTPSQSFEISTEPSPSISTTGTGTAVPTSKATSKITTDLPTVPFEDNVGPADSTSVVEESLGLTLSPKPSIVNVGITSVPTVSTFFNETLIPASIPPTRQASNGPAFASTSKQNVSVAITSNVPSPSGSGSTLDQLQLPMTTPSPTVNGVFGNMRVADPAANERICSDTLRLIPEDGRDEFEVAFMYAVEYQSVDIHDHIDDLETLILDFVAKSVLKCAVATDSDVVETRKLGEAENAFEGFIGVRYPEFGQITSISSCDTLTTLQSNGCAIVISKLLVTSVGVPNVEAHHDILLVLNDLFKEKRVVEVMPEVLATSYLGPDPKELELSTLRNFETNSAGISGAYHTTLVVILLICSLILL